MAPVRRAHRLVGSWLPLQSSRGVSALHGTVSTADAVRPAAPRPPGRSTDPQPVAHQAVRRAGTAPALPRRPRQLRQPRCPDRGRRRRSPTRSAPRPAAMPLRPLSRRRRPSGRGCRAPPHRRGAQARDELGGRAARHERSEDRAWPLARAAERIPRSSMKQPGPGTPSPLQVGPARRRHLPATTSSAAGRAARRRAARAAGSQAPRPPGSCAMARKRVTASAGRRPSGSAGRQAQEREVERGVDVEARPRGRPRCGRRTRPPRGQRMAALSVAQPSRAASARSRSPATTKASARSGCCQPPRPGSGSTRTRAPIVDECQRAGARVADCVYRAAGCGERLTSASREPAAPVERACRRRRTGGSAAPPRPGRQAAGSAHRPAGAGRSLPPRHTSRTAASPRSAPGRRRGRGAPAAQPPAAARRWSCSRCIRSWMPTKRSHSP